MFRATNIGLPLCLLLVFGLSIDSQAQSPNFDFGIKAGMTISSHTDKFNYSGDLLTPEPAVGFQLGGIFRTNLNDRLRAALEPSLIMLGARYNETVSQQGQTFETDTRTRLLYLHMPLLIQIFHAPRVRGRTVYGQQFVNYSYHITTGLFGEYLIDARFKGSNSFDGRSNPVSENVINQYSKYDGGGIIGLGMEFRETIGFEGRFQYTFLQSYNGNPRIRPKNYAIKISIVYLL